MIHHVIVATATIGLIAMLAGCFDRPEPPAVVQPVPFAEAFKCPPHGPGLSCIRMRERGKAGVAL